jgi:hypothetical protein
MAEATEADAVTGVDAAAPGNEAAGEAASAGTFKRTSSTAASSGVVEVGEDSIVSEDSLGPLEFAAEYVKLIVAIPSSGMTRTALFSVLLISVGDSFAIAFKVATGRREDRCRSSYSCPTVDATLARYR